MKEILKASRDIRKGENLVGIIEVTKGYFHFFDTTGTAFRAQQLRRTLTPQQLLEREQERVKLFNEREARKKKRLADRIAAKEAVLARKKKRMADKLNAQQAKLMRAATREAKIRERIAALQRKI